MTHRIQEPPFTIKLTLNEGCNLYCDFCGLRGIRTREVKNYKPMTLDTIRSIVNNAGGAGAPPNQKKAGKRCHRPFREMDIRWDGTVGLCCQDWRGAYRCGSVITDGLSAVWQGEAINAARVKLYHGQRDFSICNGCDSHSGRSGLLPDPSGKATLPLPDVITDAVIATATAGQPYTAPVLRPWEKSDEA
mgnify:CR=1 FL=1